MVNFLEETMLKMQSVGKTINDIEWVGCDDFYLDIKEFVKLAEDIEYNNSFGQQEIAADLKIVFNDGSVMVRKEHDGAEEWVYYSIRQPDVFSNIVALSKTQSKEFFNNNAMYNEYPGESCMTLRNINRAAFGKEPV